MAKRALFCAAVTFSAATWLTPFANGSRKLFCAGVCAISFAALLICKRVSGHDRRKLPYNTLMIIFASAFAAVVVSLIRVDVINEGIISRYENTTAACSGRVEEIIGVTGYSGMYKVKVHSVNGEKADLSVCLSVPDSELDCGDIISGEFSFSRLSADVNGFDEERYSLSRGMILCAESDGCTLDGYDDSGMLFPRINRKISGYIVAVLGRDAGGLVCALLLGNRRYLDSGVEFSFRMLGLSHILALSGMHLSIMSQIILSVLKKLKLPRKIRTIMLGIVIMLYMALTGFSLSVMRAGIMLIISLVGDLAGRSSDPLTSLATAVMLILVVRPFSVYDVGLQLSFVCVLTIITLSPIFSGVGRIYKGKNRVARLGVKAFAYFASLLIISILTSLATLPIISAYYGEISVVSPLANLIFVPIITVLMWMMTLLLPVSLVMPSVSVFLRRICLAVIRLSETTGDSLGKTVSLKYPFAPIIIVLLSAFLLAAMFTGKKYRVLSLGGAAVCVAVFAALSVGYNLNRDGVVKISAAYYNKSDALIVTDGSKAGIIDISNGSFSAGRCAINEMKENCITEMEFYLLTHLHQRHIKTFGRLCDTVNINVLILPMPMSETDESVYLSLLYIAERENIPVITYDRDGGYAVLSENVIFTYGEYNVPSRSTHPVITFALDVGDERYLYLGSSFEEGAYADLTDVNADGLILGTHGPVRKEMFDLMGADADSVMFTSIEAGAYIDVPAAAPVMDKYIVKVKK